MKSYGNNMKIYTKTGDKGKTSLACGQRVAKDCLRIESYGNIDELNSHLGLLKDLLEEITTKKEFKEQLVSSIQKIQNILFCIGSELATTNPNEHIKKIMLNSKEALILEKQIDDFSEHLPPLTNFILPGGHPCNSQAHIARSVCRRAERLVIQLSNNEAVRTEIIIYLNRLSDWLFIVARMISFILKTPEIIWEQ